ncbi:hypothetical protein E2C01_044619 [Portunus trituberculatus]|uniref:Uncharacterized protein n=1 Tax=Portunus trituberculatus TaxID=210409 RepID=A0A5B7FZQ0_PORTR|nr:hypothetical protein [Portunus trituberculatus]
MPLFRSKTRGAAGKGGAIGYVDGMKGYFSRPVIRNQANTKQSNGCTRGRVEKQREKGRDERCLRECLFNSVPS